MYTHIVPHNIPRSKRLLFSLISGALLYAAFPPISFSPFALVALIPLYLVLKDSKVLNGYSSMFWFSMSFWLLIFTWIVPFVNSWTHSIWFGLIPWVILAFILSFYSGLIGSIFVFVRNRSSWPPWILFPAAWTVIEYSRSSWPLNGFPWTLLGTVFFRHPIINQLASIGGVWILGFSIAVVNVLIVEWKSMAFMSKVYTVNIALLLSMYSAFTYLHINNQKPVKVEAAILQTGVNEAVQASPQVNADLENAIIQSIHALPPKSDRIIRIAILPESSSPNSFSAGRISQDSRWLPSLKYMNCDALILGIQHEAGNDKVYNSAVILNSRGEALDFYDKVTLVAFGEYVPFRKQFPFLSELSAVRTDVSSGEHLKPLDFDYLHIGTPICFESLYPSICRKMALQKSDFLAIIVNDDWYPVSARWQHAMATPIRAIETGRSILRSTPTGISMIVKPNGSFITVKPLQSSIYIARIQPLINTIYDRCGDWFIDICVIILLLSITFGRKPKQNIESEGKPVRLAVISGGEQTNTGDAID